MTNSLKLYQITEQYKQIEALEDSDDLPPELIRDTLESLEGDFKDKSIAIGKFIRNLSAGAAAKESEAEQIYQAAVRLRKREESVKAWLLYNMQVTGINKIESPWFTLSIRKNPEAVKIADGALLPAEFMVVPEPPPPRPDKAAIKAALKLGVVIDGAWLEQGEHLSIKL